MLVEKNIPMLQGIPGLDKKIDRDIEKIAEENGMRVDPFQISAARECVKNGLFILTGGPGTGKTTTINMITDFSRLLPFRETAELPWFSRRTQRTSLKLTS